MTIGEKIYTLRTAHGISQEELAERLSVSRQSVSKWEMNHASPGIEKIMQLSEIFKITTDELLFDRIQIKERKRGEKRKNKYFGTDGFRGEANVTLNSMHAYKIGRFLGWYYSSTHSGCAKAGYRPRIVIGKDTRRSSYMLEYSIVAGITASGADAYMLNVTTTPSVSYVTRQDGFDCGIMITASHNPYYDNGIKIINRYGEKLDDDTTLLIEDYIDGELSSFGISGEDLPLARGEKIGYIIDYVSGRNRYVGYLISLASNSYKKLRIGLDLANGAAWSIAGAVFGALGAETSIIGAEPDGLNINRECGSTRIESLRALVKEKHLDLGFAFDGDCDRCLAVDENGCVVDGDAIMYILAKRLKGRGMLNGDTVVSTVMSNSGLDKALSALGISTVRTRVGDRFVYECMQENDYSLGGEQSGHIIIKKYATTGDGLLTAIMICEELCDTKSTLSELKAGIKLYPQYVKNVKVTDKRAVMQDKIVKSAILEAEGLINGAGRILIRESGTEPLVRIMVECEIEEFCSYYSEIVERAIKEAGYCIE